MIAKLEQGESDLEAQPVNVQESLDRVRRLLVHRYGDRALSVETDVPRNLPMAMAVPTHFDEVLTNLIGNALEHTDSGGIRVVVSPQGDRLRVAVRRITAGAFRATGPIVSSSAAARPARTGLAAAWGWASTSAVSSWNGPSEDASRSRVPGLRGRGSSSRFLRDGACARHGAEGRA